MGRMQLWLPLLFAPMALWADDAPPRSLDPRLKIELFAEHPQIVTPTGIDIDHLGRVWAIENNTHFQPEGYQGHPTDRVLVMRDGNGDGRVDQTVVFLDSLRDTMSVALRPVWFRPEKKSQSPKVSESQSADKPPRSSETLRLWDIATLSVYIATRRDITLYHDDNGDLKPDRRERIVSLETAGNYPHNALAGFAFDALGWMYFGFGENLGENYKITGSDGTTLSGGGEGGNVYRCRLDGTKLEQLATGFWNPHASCVDAFGRLFTVDNDPDSRPPCRLLHVIKGGDYGFRFRNGRKGLHPFTSWNGEIPGTLPMVSGTGEAPSGILAYESDGLPEDYIGNLLVTSWGDHRIDRFRLKPRGASFEALPEPVILGGQDFRPVGIACAPDGSLYCTDWMLYDYRVHRKGRVWRVSAVKPPAKSVATATSHSQPRSIAELDNLLKSNRIDLRRASAASLRLTMEGRQHLLAVLRNNFQEPRARIEALWSLAQVPVESQRILDDRADRLWSAIFDPHDLACAAYELIGTPQLPLNAYLDWSQAPSRRRGTPGATPSPEGPEIARELLALLPFARHYKMGGIAYIVALEQRDPFLFAGVVNALAELPAPSEADLNDAAAKHDDRSLPTEKRPSAFESAFQLAGLLAMRSSKLAPQLDARLREFLTSSLAERDEPIRRAAVQWVAEERLSDLRPQVEAILNDPTISADLFLATLAALEMLDGVKPVDFDKTPAGKYVLPMVQDEKRPASVRALALRLVDPAEPALDADLLGNLLLSNDNILQLEAVRTLQQSPVEQAFSLLREVAADESRDPKLRAEAVVGLARPEADGRLAPQTRDLLVALLGNAGDVLKREALRALRGAAAQDIEVRRAIETLANNDAKESPIVAEAKRAVANLAVEGSGGLRPPLAGEELRRALLEPARATDDPQAGRRTFFHPQGAGCFKCHTINGRGGRVGPDLSTIGRLSRERLIESILDPSREIAPQFVTWALETSDGKVHTGMIVRENADTGFQTRTIVGDAEGKTTELRTDTIVSRTPQKVSIMPDKLAERMSLHEFRDLLAYLESLK